MLHGHMHEIPGLWCENVVLDKFLYRYDEAWCCLGSISRGGEGRDSPLRAEYRVEELNQASYVPTHV